MEESRPASGQPKQGVYYSRDDCAGFWRRLVVDFVDFTLLFVVVMTITLAVALTLSTGMQAAPHVFFWSGIALAFVYLVLLKRSRLRTLGYLVGGVKVVNYQGESPSIWSLMVRASFGFLGPLNMLIDVIWVTSDERRQALRDKLAHTYVIRNYAIPMGHGTIVYARYTILGANFLFAEVRPEKGDAI